MGANSEADQGPLPGRRLVAVAWQRPGTGLTRVADRLLGSLGPEWSVDLVGVGYGGPVRRRGRVTLHPSDPGGRDTFGVYAAVALVERAPAPDAVLVHNDLWLLPRYAQGLAPAMRSLTEGGATAGSVPLLAYLPLDGEVGSLPPEALEDLLPYDGIAVYTEWAREGLARALASLGDASAPYVVRVGHGVDAARFRPVAPPHDADAMARGRTSLKRRLFPDLEHPSRTLLILNANRPDARKRIDLTLEGFADFLGRVPDADARLVLHHALTTEKTSAALRAAADRLGIRSKVVFDPLGSEGVADDARLADLMAACEIGLNTSMGEGWGLLAFEHAATGAAQVLGRHSAHTELWDRAALLIEAARRRVPRSSPLEMAELDPGAVGEALATLYRDRATLHEVALRCHRRATRPCFSWTVVTDAFRSFLDAARGHAISA